MALLPDTAVFEFEDGEVEMRLGGISTRDLLDLQGFLWSADALSEDGMRRTAALVDDRRVSWTYDGEALDRPWQWNLALMQQWLKAVGTAPLPLPVRRSEPAS